MTAGMKREEGRPRGARSWAWLLRLLAFCLVLPLILVGAWLVAGPMISRGHADSLRRRLEARHPELATVDGRHPAREANTTALALEAAAVPLGLDLVPRWRAAPTVPAGPGDPLGNAFRQYVDRQLASPQGIQRPPADVADALGRQAEPLAVLRGLLVAGAPEWESGDVGGDIPIPNLKGHVQLCERLLADAFVAILDGRLDEAEADLEASWRLHEGLAKRGDLISQLVGIAVARQTAIAVRKLPSIPEDWDARLDVAPLRRGLADAVLVEAASSLRQPSPARQAGASRPAAIMQGLQEPILRAREARGIPYLVDVAAALRDPSRCGTFAPVPPGPEWETMGPGLALRLDELALQLELTRKAAQVRRLAGPEGPWPETIPGIEASDCAALRWAWTGGESARIVAEGSIVSWIVRPGGAGPSEATSFALP